MYSQYVHSAHVCKHCGSTLVFLNTRYKRYWSRTEKSIWNYEPGLKSIHVMHHVTMVRMLSFYEYSTRFSTRRLRFEMAPKKKAAKDAATDIPQVCWCYSALNDPFEDLLIDPEIGDNVFTLGKMTPYCHYVAAQRDSAITTTPPKKQRTLDPKSEAKRITSPKMYGTSPSKALRFHILSSLIVFIVRMLVVKQCGPKK